jgi:hypothetical protein
MVGWLDDVGDELNIELEKKMTNLPPTSQSGLRRRAKFFCRQLYCPTVDPS